MAASTADDMKSSVVMGEGQEIPVKYRAKFVPDESLLSHELRRKLWEGLLPLKIDLALNDNNTLERPRSLYVSELDIFCKSKSSSLFVDNGT